MKTYRVNKIRSERACEREGYEPKEIEAHVGDYAELEEAINVYNDLHTGTETAKELLYIDDEQDITIEIKTTY